jgi:hypothetical protein
MARVKTAKITRKRHKKVLKQAKGYYGAKHYRFRNANQAVLKSLSMNITPDNPCPTGEVNRVVKGVILYPYTRD